MNELLTTISTPQPMSIHQQLCASALTKMIQGSQLYNEGRIAWDELTAGLNELKDVTSTVKANASVIKRLPAKAKQHLLAPPKKEKTKAKAKLSKSMTKNTNNNLDLALQDRIINVITNHDWVSMKILMDLTKSSHYPLKRELNRLVKEGKIESAKKAGNPAWTNKASKAKLMPYWVLKG